MNQTTKAPLPKKLNKKKTSKSIEEKDKSHSLNNSPKEDIEDKGERKPTMIRIENIKEEKRVKLKLKNLISRNIKISKKREIKKTKNLKEENLLKVRATRTRKVASCSTAQMGNKKVPKSTLKEVKPVSENRQEEQPEEGKNTTKESGKEAKAPHKKTQEGSLLPPDLPFDAGFGEVALFNSEKSGIRQETGEKLMVERDIVPIVEKGGDSRKKKASCLRRVDCACANRPEYLSLLVS
jgi:hypothetical protein